MVSEKKPYRAPQLTYYGKVEDITQQGGGNRIDVPQGTVIAPGSTINDVTS
jgi:hypothetical protein